MPHRWEDWPRWWLLSVAGLYFHGQHTLPDPIGQWNFAFPSIAYGVLAALSRRHGSWFVPVGFIAMVGSLGAKVESRSHQALRCGGNYF